MKPDLIRLPLVALVPGVFLTCFVGTTCGGSLPSDPARKEASPAAPAAATPMVFATPSSPEFNAELLRQVREQIRALEKAQAGLSNELKQLRAQIRSKDSNESFITIPEPATALGDPNAPVTVVEFGDFDCSFCRQHFQETFPRIKREYLDTGKVRYVFGHFPVGSDRAEAVPAAEAARCAAEQGKFWPLQERLMQSTAPLDLVSLVAHAEAVGLDSVGLRECLASRKHQAAIQEQITEATKAGIKGTPTFFVGKGGPDARKIKVERTLQGAPPFWFFKQQIDELLGR